MSDELRLTVEMVDINKIHPSPYNPRKWNDKMYKRTLASIKEFGLVEPLVVNKRTNNIVGGNRRFQAIIALGHKEVPVSWVDLDEDREKLLNVVLNDIDFGFDNQKLEVILLEIQKRIDSVMYRDVMGITDQYRSNVSTTPEIEFSPIVHKKMDYVMVLFDNTTDFINFTGSMGLTSVYDVLKNKKIGVGRVITYQSLVEWVKNANKP